MIVTLFIIGIVGFAILCALVYTEDDYDEEDQHERF